MYYLKKKILVREGLKKPIESVIMIIAGEGGSTGGDHTPLGFFWCSKPSCLAILSPKTNFVLIKKFQFQTIFNISDHIDLPSTKGHLSGPWDTFLAPWDTLPATWDTFPAPWDTFPTLWNTFPAPWDTFLAPWNTFLAPWDTFPAPKDTLPGPK